LAAGARELITELTELALRLEVIYSTCVTVQRANLPRKTQNRGLAVKRWRSAHTAKVGCAGCA
jgi:hypothetical protein